MTFSEFLRKEYDSIAPIASSAPHLYDIWIKVIPIESWINLAQRWHEESLPSEKELNEIVFNCSDVSGAIDYKKCGAALRTFLEARGK